jgi:hypothetical protein
MRLLFAAMLLLGACGDNLAHVSCASAADCAASSTLVPQTRAECCGGSCVVPSVGCDSGWRYLIVGPGYGECAAITLCGAPDMSVPIDLAPRGG